VHLGDIQSGPFCTFEPEQSSWVAGRGGSASYQRGGWPLSHDDGGRKDDVTGLEEYDAGQPACIVHEDGQSGCLIKLQRLRSIDWRCLVFG